jgi:hypothetical protein
LSDLHLEDDVVVSALEEGFAGARNETIQVLLAWLFLSILLEAK